MTGRQARKEGVGGEFCAKFGKITKRLAAEPRAKLRAEFMSRIGKKPIPLPKGVTVKIEGNTVAVQGPKGKLDTQLPAGIRVRAAGRESGRDSRERFAGRGARPGSRPGEQRRRRRHQGMDARTGNRRHRLSRRNEGQRTRSCSRWDIRTRSSIRCRPALTPRSIPSRPS